MECINCGARDEVLVPHSDKGNVVCNRCNTKMVEIPTSPDFIINGCKSHKGMERKNFE
jgi:predicted nucleic acid-binding Zn ribbon protein